MTGSGDRGGSGDGRRRRALLAAIFLPAVVLTAHASLFIGPSRLVDDAFISYRYARNLASGEGLVYNPGERVEGYTNFTWVVVAAAALSVGLPLEDAMPALGFACALAVLGITAHRARRTYGPPGTAPPTGAGLPAGLLLAWSTGFVCYAVTGLETALFTLLMLGAMLALTERRAVPFALLTALAFLTRPEAGLLGVAGVLLMVARPREGAGRLRDPAVAAALMAAVLLPYLAFKQLYFGSLVPNTLGAKYPSPAEGLDYLLDNLWRLGGVPLAALVAWRERRRREIGELLGMTLVYWVAVVFEGGDWMPTSRLLVPTLPWLAIAADRTVLDWVRLRPPRVLAVAGLALLVPFLGAQPMDSHTLWKGFEVADPVYATRAHLARRWEREGVESVALVDIGLTGYAAPGIRIIDLAGLTDRTIAASPGGHLEKRPDPAYLESLAPDLVVLTSRTPATDDGDGQPRFEAQFGVEQYLEQSRWLRDHYRFRRTVLGHPRYHMHVYQRRPPPRGASSAPFPATGKQDLLGV